MTSRLLAIACFGFPILLTLPASAENADIDATAQSLRSDAAELDLEFAGVNAYVIEALDALHAAKLRGDFNTIESAIQTQRKK